VNEFGIRRQLAPIGQPLALGVGGQLLACPGRAEKAFEQTHQRIERRLAAPQACFGLVPIKPEDIDKSLGLAGLDGIRPGVQGHRDVGPRLASMLHHRQCEISSSPLRPNKAWALSQGSPNNPCSTKPLEIQPDLANDGSNRVYSQTRKPPTDRPPLRPAWPASSTCRRTSPGRTGPPRQGDQADADQRIGLPSRPKIDIAEQDDHGDGDAPDADEQAGQILPVLGAQPGRTQQPGHDQIVADHGRQGDGFNDHHAGRRRQTTNENQQGQRFGTMRQRQVSTKVSGLTPSRQNAAGRPRPAAIRKC
jgi:hypothetical protein